MRKLIVYILVCVMAVPSHGILRDIYPKEDGAIFKETDLSSGHNILSVTHLDSAVSAAARGSLIVRNNASKWARLSLGNSGETLISDGTDAAWGVLDISAGTNLAVSAPVTLTDDTIGWDSTLIDATTWSDGANASNLWTFDVSGTNPTIAFGDDVITLSSELAMADNPITGVSYIEIIENGYIAFDIDNHPEGSLSYNRTDATLDLGKPGGNVTQQLGEEFLKRVKNETGTVILNGTPVYVTGSSGGRITVAPADADFAGGIAFRTYAIATEDIPITGSQLGYVTKIGLVRGINTVVLVPAAGVPVYLAVGGTPADVSSYYSTSPPTAPDVTVLLGIVEKRSEDEGELDVHILTIPNLNSLSDVNNVSLADGNILAWNASNNVWDNLTKQNSGFLVDFENDTTTGKLTADGGFNINSVLDMTGSSAGSATLINHQATVSGDQLITQYRAADSDGTDNVQLILTGKGSWSTSPSNYHSLQMRWNGSTAYEIFTSFAASELYKPLNIGTHLDPDMIVIRESDVKVTTPLKVGPTTALVTIDDNVISVTDSNDNIIAMHLHSEGTDAVNANFRGGSGSGGLRVGNGGGSDSVIILPTSIATNGSLDLTITAGGGDISFGDENLTTTGDLNVGTGGVALDVDSAIGVDVVGRVGVGTAAVSNTLLKVGLTFAPDDDFSFIGGTGVVTPSVAAKDFRALNYIIQLQGSTNTAAITGVYSMPELFTYTGTLDELTGFRSDITVNADGGIVTNGYGFKSTGTVSGAGRGTATLSDFAHLDVYDLVKVGNTSVPLQYGLRIADMTAATDNWAIKTGLGDVEFGGDTYWTGTGGLVLGAMNIPSVDIVVSIADANPTEVFDDGTTSLNDGWASTYQNSTVFAVSDLHYITVTIAGTYKVDWNMSGHIDSGANSSIHGGVMIDGAATRDNGEDHTDVLNANDSKSMSGTAVIDCPNGTEEISLWISNDNSADVHVEHGNMAITQVGGT